MTPNTIRKYDTKTTEHMDFVIDKRADGFYNEIMGLVADLNLGAKSLTLTLSTGVGSVPIPDTATLLGIKPAVGALRVGLEAPEADGTKTGDAVASDLKKGFPIDGGVWTWFQIGTGTDRTLYVKGGSSDVLEVVVS